jgi:hypothetical protein
MLSQERNLVTELRSGRLRWTDQPGDDYGSRSPEVRMLGWLLGLSEMRATTRLVASHNQVDGGAA